MASPVYAKLAPENTRATRFTGGTLPPDDFKADLTRWMARQAALLITLALFTGFLVAAAMTGKVPADGHAMLASHLNALLGAFWVLGVGFSLPWVRFSERATRWHL